MLKAEQTWLKNTEVCELLLNYVAYNLPVSKEPPNQPPGGTVYLFDRRAVRFFRKDGHNWRKKADGKTVRETHEKLKVGNMDMLNCYYAHAEQDDGAQGPRLQRRCYWLLESEDDIVLVHYLNVDKAKGRADDAPPGIEPALARRMGATVTSGVSQMGMQAPHQALHVGAGQLRGGDAGLDPFVPLLPSMSLDSFFGGTGGADAAAAAAAVAAANAAPPAPEALLQTLSPWDELGGVGGSLAMNGTVPSLGLVPSLDSLGSDWQALFRSDTLRLVLPSLEAAGSLDASGDGRGGGGWLPAGDDADAMRTPSLEARQAQAAALQLRAAAQAQQQAALQQAHAASLRPPGSAAAAVAPVAQTQAAAAHATMAQAALSAGLSPQHYAAMGALLGAQAPGVAGRGTPGLGVLPSDAFDVVAEAVGRDGASGSAALPAVRVWRGGPGFMASQVLALEAALAGLDRQVMEQLMTRQAGDGSTSQPTLDKKVVRLEDDLMRLEAGAQHLANASESDPGEQSEPERGYSDFEDVGSPPALQGAEPGMAAFEMLDFWPDWDAAAGGAVVTVTWSAAGSTAAPPGSPRVMFGDAQVPTEALRPGVLCCAAPPHAPGVVRLCLSLDGDARVRSNALPFRFRAPPPAVVAPVAADPPGPLALPDRDLAEGVESILGNVSAAGKGSSAVVSMASAEERVQGMLRRCIAEYSTKRLMRAGAAAAGSAAEGEERLLRTRSGSVGAALLHLAAGLGYGWAVDALLGAGARPDMQDAHGWALDPDGALSPGGEPLGAADPRSALALAAGPNGLDAANVHGGGAAAGAVVALENGDASREAVVARARAAVEAIVSAHAKLARRRAAREERRERIATRAAEALARMADSNRTWQDVHGIAEREMRAAGAGPDAPLRRFLALGGRIVRLSALLEHALRSSACEGLGVTQRNRSLRHLRDSRRKSSSFTLRSMEPLTDAELSAFLADDMTAIMDGAALQRALAHVEALLQLPNAHAQYLRCRAAAARTGAQGFSPAGA
ncbi:hypothetical protein WJX81_007767 [Elliptochloris bilobata]|uniref:CG-1 domain-containing protein n=1 Tax=Elliptochloris bilobata TaxID=381761 RepID=A0AAW1SL75_9CHLO